jgi:precorrin-6B methylase 2
LKFIGDLSLEDADLLALYGKRAKRILEFGCGGSTQIFSQCNPDRLVSIETNQDWIEVTKRRVAKLGGTEPDFRPYDFIPMTEQFDLIFVDGIDSLRRDFALGTWKMLAVGGSMIFHDTRRFQDFQNVAWVAQTYFNEILTINVNSRARNNKSSNMTTILKKEHEPYVNWNYSEGKPLEAYGDLSGNDEFFPVGLWNEDMRQCNSKK